MWLRGCQRLMSDSSGRFAPFMFGLLLAVSAFSMTMKSRVEAKLEQQKVENERRQQLAAEDLRQALETEMLLENSNNLANQNSYNSTIDIGRARRYLSRSSGQTAGSGTPTLDNQTGSALDNLTRQTTLIGVTDAPELQADIVANSAATTYNTTGALPTTVFDAQAPRQKQLTVSKQALDAFSTQALSFALANGRLPDATDMTSMSTTTGLRTYWGGTFTNTVNNIFSVQNAFTSPWGSDTYSNTVTLPYTSTNPPYTWASAAATQFGNSDSAFGSGESIVAVGNGTIALGVTTFTSTSYTYIFEQQNGSWVEKQSVLGHGGSGYGLDIDEDLMVINDAGDSPPHLDIYKRQQGSWQKIQQIADPNGGPAGNFGLTAKIKKIGGRAYLYASDHNGTNGQIAYFIATSTATPNFVYQTTVTPSCPLVTGLAVDAPYSLNTLNPAPYVAMACPGYSSNTGRVYVYQGTTLLQTLQPSTAAANDYFGWRISMQWPYLAIGAYADEVASTDQGAVYIYQDMDSTFSKANFTQMTMFQESAATAGTGTGCTGSSAKFGYNVSFIDNRSLAVMANCTNLSGATASSIFIYTLGSAGWAKVSTISNPNSASNYHHGGYMDGKNGIMAFSKYYGTTTPNFYVYTAPEY